MSACRVSSSISRCARQVRAAQEHLARCLIEEPLLAMRAEITALGDDFSSDQGTGYHVIRTGPAFRCALGIRQPPDLQQGGAVIEGSELFEEGWVGHVSFPVQRAWRTAHEKGKTRSTSRSSEPVPVHARHHFRDHATVARRCTCGATPASCQLALRRLASRHEPCSRDRHDHSPKPSP